MGVISKSSASFVVLSLVWSPTSCEARVCSLPLLHFDCYLCEMNMVQCLGHSTVGKINVVVEDKALVTVAGTELAFTNAHAVVDSL